MKPFFFERPASSHPLHGALGAWQPWLSAVTLTSCVTQEIRSWWHRPICIVMGLMPVSQGDS